MGGVWRGVGGVWRGRGGAWRGMGGAWGGMGLMGAEIRDGVKRGGGRYGMGRHGVDGIELGKDWIRALGPGGLGADGAGWGWRGAGWGSEEVR